MRAKECTCAHASTYQLISSKFLSSLKHGPKVDCGKQKTNKRVRTSGEEAEPRRMMSQLSQRLPVASESVR